MAEKKDKNQKAAKSAAAMVAPHPLGRGKRKKEDLRPVEELAEDAGLKPWEEAGLMRAAGWAEGKQVTKGRFDEALAAFRARPQGSGRLQA